METTSLEIGLNINAEQLATVESWLFWNFVSAFPAMLVGQAARARAEIKGPILGGISRQLDQEIPF